MRDVLSDLRSSGASLFGQGSRLLKLRFAERSGIGEEALLPHRLKGEERLSQTYRYTLECLSPDVHLELKTLLGQAVEIVLLLPDGGARLLTGLVTAAAQNGADGGFARYTLTIEPALATLRERRNSRVFQDKSVPEIVATILDEHLAQNSAFTGAFHYRQQLTQTYPTRSYTLQYRETDLAFIERLLAEEGINTRYTHGPDPDTSIRQGQGSEGRSRDRQSSGQNSHEQNDGDDSETDTSGIPQHTLIFFDSAPAYQEDDPHSTIRYHRTDGVESSDAVDDWNGTRSIQSGHTQLASYDYQAVSTHVGEDATRTQSAPGDTSRNSGNGRNSKAGNSKTDSAGAAVAALTGGLEDYDPQGPYYGADPAEVERYAKLRQQRKDQISKTFTGQSTVRHLTPGDSFQLIDHPIHDQDNPEDRQFLVTGLTFEAENNLTPEAKQSLGGLLSASGNSANSASSATAAGTQNTPPYRNTLETVRRHVPVVPDYTRTAHQKPTAGGMTTATVVGPEGEEIFTDAHGRIKIQFHWQRTQDHPEGGADYDDHSSTWVRVAYPGAGAAWGDQYIPRIGQEVTVSFLENDIDRPLVTGVVYNGTHRPPTFSGAGKLPANKTLSGHKSKEYKGSRYNELLFDDSTGEIRTKLSTEHGKTQLNQGYLIHPRTEGKGEPRGEGFELRTDNHGAIRAAQGLFLTTEAQNGATGKQIARDHAQSQADAALELTKSLGEVATKQLADTIEHGPEKISPDNAKEEKTTQGHLKHHIDALKAWEAGTNTDKESKTKNDEQGRQPIMVLSAPAGISALTAQNLSLAAGTNLDQIAQRDTNQTSGRRWLHNVGQHISLFVNGVKDKISLKLIAAQGKVQMQAQHGEIEVTADQNINVTSCKRKITIPAQKEVLLTSGGAYIRIKDGRIELHCPGILSIKAANRVLEGPDAMFVPMPQFPNNVCKECLRAAMRSGSPFVAPASA